MHPPSIEPRPRLSVLVWICAAAAVALQLSTAGRYGIFRDEFYYLMCAHHLAWGYVDHPPLSIAFLSGWTAAFGDGVIALRVPPALLHGIAIVMTGAVARELRGGAPAQLMAALMTALAPGILALGNFYSMNAFDVAFWITAAWIVCRLLDGADRRWWWGLGVVLGLGVINKYSMAFLGVGLAVGILCSPLRRELLSRPAIGGFVIAVLIVLPHLAWQVTQGWPTLEFMHNASRLKNVRFGPLSFWAEQMLMAHPLYLPLAALGTLALLVSRRLRRWRPVGIAFTVVAAWLTFTPSKAYYMVPAYPMVFAAGAVALFNGLAQWPRRAWIPMLTTMILVAGTGLALAPMAAPLLDVDRYLAFDEALHIRPTDMEITPTAELPQHFADRFGWRELATAVAEVVDGLPRGERDSALIIADNYGECGALEYYGRQLGLPPAVSGHNSCFTWWDPGIEPSVAIVVGHDRAGLEEKFEQVELGGTGPLTRGMPYERSLPIWICREPRLPWARLRAEFRFAI